MIWFYPPILDYDVSLHILVVLVVVIPTSPRSSKTEFVCKRYCVSRVCASGIPASSEFSGLFRTDSELEAKTFFPDHSGRILNKGGNSLLGIRNIPDHSGSIPDVAKNRITVR